MTPLGISREQVASAYLRGEGIEIGALHQPLRVPQAARVRYVDRLTVAEFRKHYPELDGQTLVDVDVLDDGERLSTFVAATQDFVIANHFVEHCENPLGAICNMLRVLRRGGILFLAIPDKRYTFDVDRPLTPIVHLLAVYREGVDPQRRQHYEEWTRLVNKRLDPAEAEAEVRHLMAINYSIHHHVWTLTELVEMILTVRKELKQDFEMEMCLSNGDEVLFILRRT